MSNRFYFIELEPMPDILIHRLYAPMDRISPVATKFFSKEVCQPMDRICCDKWTGFAI